MQRGRASQTAETIALYRALDLILNKEPIIRDPWAEKMLRPAWRIPLKLSLLRAFYIRFVNDLRPLMVTSSARSRIAEDRFEEMRSRGPVQWVLLGAGLDTFAWRHPQYAELPQFEVDHPDSQTHKRAITEKLGLRSPKRHQFVPVDFERTRISEALLAAGYDPQVPSVFAWLGVTYYLTSQAIVSTMTDLASIANKSSVLVCDYRLPDRHVAAVDAPFIKKGDQLMKKWDEPHLSKLEPEEWNELAATTGWRIEADHGPQQLGERFASGSRAGLRPLSNYRVLAMTPT